METIRLNNLVPHVFAQSGDLGSAVWQRDVTFHKGHLYLVEAESGKGKSTFCSYLLGYRHDYSGELYFDDRLASRLRVADTPFPRTDGHGKRGDQEQVDGF